MDFDNAILKNEEAISLALRSLYARCGYQQYRMSRFEEYELYVRNKDFLISSDVITFTDTLLPGYMTSYPVTISFDGANGSVTFEAK